MKKYQMKAFKKQYLKIHIVATAKLKTCIKKKACWLTHEYLTSVQNIEC